MAEREGVEPMDIHANIRTYLDGNGAAGGLKPDERYASFDYCYNYFRSFREQERVQELASPENIQVSCLHLGFYLASWGMLRGSSLLLQKSARYYRPVIQSVANLPMAFWDVDVDRYDDNVEMILECSRMIRQAIGQGRDTTDTLVTKILLGVFGNVPAFDTYFKAGMGTYSFGRKSLRRIAEFYRANRSELDQYQIRTLDFATGQETDRVYPMAKLIDMVCFVEGMRPSPRH